MDYHSHAMSVIEPFDTANEALLDCKRRLENLPDLHCASVETLWCESGFVGISRLRVVLCDRQGAADAWNDGATSVEMSDRLVEQRLRLVIGEHFGGAHERDRKSLALCPAGTGGHR